MILVADDTAEVRTFLHDFLTMSGYEVILAEDGQIALDTFDRMKDSIELVILDVVMPNMNGIQSYQEMRELRPEIKALFMSGYAADVIQKMTDKEEGLDILQKPLNPLVLEEKIRNMLG